ncbi:coiled-coil domain-containing protein 7 isoform X4 [Dasypus novemcinctus]|uniref:coiled-coil domain-containing protein 7 isoform X4 n=1 Tax=Dasypus novemcinctus TaxID=9361 RepID=UPI00265DF34B|nr:coiled-coil domain-containing protein 7 isoform X4 [Dasypus novemcinctus]
MKPAKHLPDTSSKLANVPGLNGKKRQLKSPISPKPKEKNSAKLVHDKIEPMVLRSPPIGESVVRYALPIPSSKTKELISEEELIKKITKHLKMVVSALEETYGYDDVSRKKRVEKPENEEESFLSDGDEINSFLLCCSQFATQLEEAVNEEHNWFQVQVNQMEELSKDQSVSEDDVPVPEKPVILSLAQIIKQMQKLEELRERLKHMTKYSFKDLLSKPTEQKQVQHGVSSQVPTSQDDLEQEGSDDRQNKWVSQSLTEPMQSHETVEKIIEDFVKKHSADQTIEVSATEPETAPSVTNKLNAMLKMFERQSNMLERAMADHDLLEAKYNKKLSDFQLLLEEKSMLEIEIQKLKNAEKIKATPDRTKKMTKKMEKKKDKGKSEELKEKTSTGKNLKIKDDLLQVQKEAFALELENKLLQEQLKQALQKAERANHQLEYFLKTEKAKTTMEMDISKIKVKGEDSENIPLEKERRKASVSHSAGQKRDEIQEQSKISFIHHGSPIEESSEKKRSSPAISDLSQILKSSDESNFSESSKEVSAGEDLSVTSPSKAQDESFTTVSPNKEIQGSLSVGTLSQGNETVTASLISLPILTSGKSTDSDTSKADASEEKLQSETEKQTYQEARQLQDQKMDVGTDKKLLRGNQNLDQKFLNAFGLKKTHRGALWSIKNSPDEVPAENLMLKKQDSVSNIQMQEKQQRTSRDEKRLKTPDEFTNQNLMSEDQESVSETQTQLKKHIKSSRKGLKTPDEVPAENLMLKKQDSVSNIQMQEKQQRTSRVEKKLKTPDVVTNQNLMSEDQESVSEPQTQLKKHIKSSRKGLKTQYEEPNENQDSVSKIQKETKKQKSSRGERLKTLHDVPNENLMVEQEDSVSKTQMDEKKRRPSRGRKRTSLDEVPDENNMFEQQNSVSKTQMKEKKQRTSKGKTVNTLDEVPYDNVMTEEEDSVSKTQIKENKQRTSRGKRISTHDEETDGSIMIKRGDSLSKNQIQEKTQRTPRRAKSNGENLMTEQKDSVSKTQTQVKKQRTSRDERFNTHVGELEENLMLESQDSESKTQMGVKKQKTFRKERLNSQDDEPDENFMFEQQDSVSEAKIQEKERGTSRGEIVNSHDEVPEENLMYEPQESISKTQMEVKKQKTFRKERLNSHHDEPDENLTFEKQDLVSKMKTEEKELQTSREEIVNINACLYVVHDEELEENLIHEPQDFVSETKMKVKKEKTFRKERLDSHDDELGENLMREQEDSLSETKIQEKEQGTSRAEILNIHDEELEENLIHEPQDFVSETQMEVKKQKTFRKERHDSHDDKQDENLMFEQQDSVSKTKIQEEDQQTSRGEIVDTHDGETGENLMVEQDSVSKTQIYEKTKRNARRERLNSHYEESDKILITEYEDSLTKNKIGQKIGKTHRGRRLSTCDEEPDEILMLENQDSVSQMQMEMKKHKTSRGESLKTEKMDKIDKNLSPEDKVLISKSPSQNKQLGTASKEGQTTQEVDEIDEVLYEDLLSEGKVSFSKNQTETKILGADRIVKPSTEAMTLPVENILSKEKDSISKRQSQTKKYGATEKDKSNMRKIDEVSDENLLPEDGKHKDSRTEIFKTKNLEESDNSLASFGEPLPGDRKASGAPRPQPKTDQDMDELSDESLTVEDLELAAGYMDQIRASGIDHSQILKIKNEMASELPDIAENLSSINDLILHLDLNKVVENDIEFLKDAIQKNIVKEEIKTQSKGPSGANLLKSKDMSIPWQDLLTKSISPSKRQTKVINLSLFENKAGTSETFPLVNESPKSLFKTAKEEPSISKTTHVTLLNKALSGQPKTVKLNKTVVELTHNLPAMVSTPKKILHKGPRKMNIHSASKQNYLNKVTNKRDYPSQKREDFFKVVEATARKFKPHS